jgi:putative transposase
MRSPVEKRLIHQAYVFELDPNEAQRVLLAKSVGCSRYVYNWALAESQRCYELTGKRPSRYELQAQLVGLKNSEAPWLYEVSAHISQQAIKDLNEAFKRFFKGLKGEGPKSGFPRFKRKGERDSARIFGVALEERHVRLPMIGRVRLKQTCSQRRFDGRVLSATIRRRADRWFVSLCVECEREIVLPKPVRRGRDAIGIDLGLKSAAVIHDGQSARVVEPARVLRKSLAKLRRLDRQLARKQKGSSNRAKANLARQRLHYKISCQRNDFLHQLSSELAKTKRLIVLEDLNLAGMGRNRRLGFSIADAGMSEFRRQLTYKSEWYGATLVVADRFFPSTQLCSGCGVLNDAVKGFAGLGERTFTCTACGLVLDRDENAALNLRAYGLHQTGLVPLPQGLREVTPVSSGSQSANGEVFGLVGEEGSGLSSIETKPASLKQEASGSRASERTRRSGTKGPLVRA